MKYAFIKSNFGMFVDSNRARYSRIEIKDGAETPENSLVAIADDVFDAASSIGLRSLAPKPRPNPIASGAAFVLKSGFDADRKVILLNKLLKVKEAGTLAANPKLVALYTWMETIQAMAVAGQTSFPEAPFTFEEVVAE